MGRFSKVNTATVSKTGQYFKGDAHYKVRIKACKFVSGQVGKNYFIVETEVLESSHPEIEVGQERSQVIDLSNVMGMPNVKHFVAAASGVEPTSEAARELVEKEWKRRLAEAGVQEHEMLALVDCETFDLDSITEWIIHEDVNPLENQVMDLECVEVETKGSKEARAKDPAKPAQYFTKHNWLPIAA